MECDDKFIDKQHTSTTTANGRRLLIHALLKCYTKLTALAISLYKKINNLPPLQFLKLKIQQ